MKDKEQGRKNLIRHGIILFVLAAVFLSIGLYFGRGYRVGGFTVTTQYTPGTTVSAAASAGQGEQDEPADYGILDEDVAQNVSLEPQDVMVNINTASQLELQQIPGVGPAIAARIVEHRETHGYFRIIEDILDVSGIGPARFADMQDFLTVE